MGLLLSIATLGAHTGPPSDSLFSFVGGVWEGCPAKSYQIALPVLQNDDHRLASL